MIKGIKKDDMVFVIAGKDRGKSGKILQVLTGSGRVIVDGVNSVKRHLRPRRSGEKGSTVSVAMPLASSNVMLKCPQCSAATRLAFKVSGGRKKRLCKKCGHEF